ncbi:MAG: HAD family hydrolase [Planctomycetota bacterium]
MNPISESLGRQIEILNPEITRGRIRHAVFDFDGTLSLIREGWQDVMVPLMVETLSGLGTGESEDELRLLILEYVTRLTGKQTIYQMIELADQVRRRGGTPLDPLEYKHEYLRRLEARIQNRIAGLERRTLDRETLLLPGSIELLDALRERKVTMYLASGTDEPFVIREAKLLGIDAYFDGGIYGALDNYKNFSKQMVIDRIIRDHGLEGPELLGIGDGYVEIENTKSVGGIALGVPCLESDPYSFDLWKKDRLKIAGADLLIPNFLEHQAVLNYLFDATA